MIGLGSKEQKQGIPMGSYDPTASSGGSGGVSSYSDLTNKPSINDVTLVGNKSASDLGLQEKFTPIDPLGFDTVVESASAGYSRTGNGFTASTTQTAAFNSDNSSSTGNISVGIQNAWVNSIDLDNDTLDTSVYIDVPFITNRFYYFNKDIALVILGQKTGNVFKPIYVATMPTFTRSRGFVTSLYQNASYAYILAEKTNTSSSTSIGANTSIPGFFVKSTEGVISDIRYGGTGSTYTTFTLTEDQRSKILQCNTARFYIMKRDTLITYQLPTERIDETSIAAVDIDDALAFPTYDDINISDNFIPLQETSSQLILSFDTSVIPNEYTLPVATTTTLGGVKPDGTTILVTADGIISAAEGGGSGTTNYLELTNKPSINSVELTGDKSLDELDIQKKLTFQAPITQTTEVTSNMTGAMVNDGYVNVTSYAQGSWYAANAGATQYLQFHEDGSTFSSDNAGFIPNFRIVMPYTSGQVVKTPSQGILLFGYFNDDGYFVPVAHESFYGTGRTGGFVISHPGYKSGSYLRFNTNYRTSASPTSISLTAQEEIAYAQLNVTSTSAQLLNYNLYYNSSGSGSYSSGRNGYTTTTASDLAECAKVTHVMHTALPTNANTYKASWYGIYACSEILGYDVDPNTFNEATSLVDATGQTTSLNVNVTKASTASVGVVKPDGTTTTVTDDGTLSINTTALVTQAEVDGLDFKKVTETEYTELTAPDTNTVYFVVADPETT